MNLRRPSIRRVASLVGWAIAGVGIIYLLLAAKQYSHDLPAIRWSAESLLAICGASLLNLVSVCTWAVAWLALLRGGGQHLSFAKSFVIIGLSQVGKYAPGKVVHLVGRAALGGAEGLQTGTVVGSLLVETMVGAAGVAAAAGIAMATVSRELPMGIHASQLLGIAAIAAAIPLLLPPLLRRWSARLPVFVRDAIPVARIGPSFLVFGVYAGGMAIHATMLVLLARGVFGIPFSDFGLAVAAISLAWLAGSFISVVPAGLGIREVVLAGVLALDVGAAGGLAIAGAHRLATVVGDGLAFAIAAAMRRRQPAAA